MRTTEVRSAETTTARVGAFGWAGQDRNQLDLDLMRKRMNYYGLVGCETV